MFLGLLYGAAIGDAVGIATEGMRPDECQFHYNPETFTYTNIVRDSYRTHWKQGDWTTHFDQVVGIYLINIQAVCVCACVGVHA